MSESDRLAHIVEQMLILAQADAGDTGLVVSDVAVGDLVDEVSRSMRALAEQRGLTLETSADDDLTVPGDRQRLEAAGLPARIDEAARASGQIILDVHATLHGEQHTLRAVFPEFYPELRFEVFAPTLDLGRHQNPFEKNLCLLDRSSRAWSTQDSVAAFLVERVPKVLELLDDQQAMQEAEVPQGEPFTVYYAYREGGIVFVPEVALRLPSTATQGFLQFRLEPQPGDGPLRSLLFEVSDGREP